MKLEEQNYIINNIKDFTFSEYLRLMKTKYETKESLFRATDLHPTLKEFFDEFWDTIEKMTVVDAFQEVDNDKKKIYFHCISPENIFKNIESELISECSLNKKKQDGTEYIDTFKLYKSKSYQFGIDIYDQYIYYLQFTCPSTHKNHYLYIDSDYIERGNTVDAIDCIAGSFVTSYKAEAISHFYRQGDQLITVIKPEYIGKGKLQYQLPRRITREEYLNKFKFET